MTIDLHVNVDHVATLRQARGTKYPDPVEAALIAERAGADGITVHLREDRRHVQPRDVTTLREVVRGTLNLEMAAAPAMVAFALQLRPPCVTLVPERREERTTEGGLDVVSHRDALRAAVRQLRDAGVKVSLFIAPDAAQIEASRALDVDQVELHTGDYANATGDALAHELEALRHGASLAHTLGLRVAAGHGLTVANVGPVAAIHQVVELNIGHAIVSDAVIVGMARAVRDMRRAMARARRVRKER